jgi:hypothetical protein
MKRTFQFAGVVLACAALALGSQAAKEVPGGTPPAKMTAPGGTPPPKTASPNTPPNGGPKGVPKIGLPGTNPFERLLFLSPEQRELALEKLPAQEKERARAIFQRFDNMRPLQKEQYVKRLRDLWNLPSDKQNLIRERIIAANKLADERLDLIKQEWLQLSRLPDDERRGLIASDVFRHKYTPDEQQILSDLSEYYPAPGR